MSDNTRMVINNVEYLRREKGWTIEKTAEEADIPFSTLKNILYRNLETITLSSIEKLANGFGISVAEMFMDLKGGVA